MHCKLYRNLHSLRQIMYTNFSHKVRVLLFNVVYFYFKHKHIVLTNATRVLITTCNLHISLRVNEHGRLSD